MNVDRIVKELKERLQLEDRALQDALAGLPSRDATARTPAENEVVANIETAAREEEIRVAAECRDNTVAALGDCKTAFQEVNRARQAIAGEAPPAIPNMAALIEARDGAKASYTAFKAQHKLQRDAAGDDRLAQIVWAVVVVVAESIFNAYFYAPISDLGLLGGLFTALFVSVANVSFAFIGGALGLRYLSHIEPAKKLIGLLAFLVCFAICALVVTMSALFRGHADAMSANTLDTGMLMANAWQASVNSLMALDVLDLLASLHSFLLALVGVICMIVGFWKGRDFDDPYPGFGAAHRRRENAQIVLDDAHAEADEKQRQWQREYKLKLLEQSHKLDRSKSGMLAAYSGLKNKIDSNSHLAEQAAKATQTLLSFYRQKNTQIRADDPPGYFDDYNIDYASLDEDIVSIGKDLHTLEVDIQGLSDKCDEELAEIQMAIAGTPGDPAR